MGAVMGRGRRHDEVTPRSEDYGLELARRGREPRRRGDATLTSQRSPMRTHL